MYICTPTQGGGGILESHCLSVPTILAYSGLIDLKFGKCLYIDGAYVVSSSGCCPISTSSACRGIQSMT